VNTRFDWSDDYCTGDATIDAQHRNLFELANRIQAHLDKEERQRELMNLYRHMREHFAAEEGLMRDSGFPDYASHRAAHDDILTSLNRISADVADHPAQLPRLRELVADWIGRHVLDADLEITEHLRTKGKAVAS
jgi:hemerythrin